MIRIANATGLATSLGGREHRRGAVDGATLARRRSATIRNAFSTITTAPSTIMPIPMANPANDIRLADSPDLAHADEGDQHRQRQRRYHDQRRAQFAEEKEQHIATSIEPSISALVAVPTALSTRSVRS